MSSLRLVYVKALTLNQHHYGVAYYHKPTSIPCFALTNIDKKNWNRVKAQWTCYLFILFNAENYGFQKKKGAVCW